MDDNNQNNEIINYEYICEIYNKNKNKKWSEWLKHNYVFSKLGKQGITGILSIKDNSEKEIVYKISKYINYLIIHEHIVMKSLNDLSPYCPHFCKSVGIISCKTD